RRFGLFPAQNGGAEQGPTARSRAVLGGALQQRLQPREAVTEIPPMKPEHRQRRRELQAGLGLILAAPGQGGAQVDALALEAIHPDVPLEPVEMGLGGLGEREEKLDESTLRERTLVMAIELLLSVFAYRRQHGEARFFDGVVLDSNTILAHQRPQPVE